MEIDWKLNEYVKIQLKANTTSSFGETDNLVSTQADE
jgi:hypothetical protein